METRIIRVDRRLLERAAEGPVPELDALLLPAARALAAGQLVAFPTETVYGLGGNALDPQAIQAIFSVKGRPADNPLIVHVAHPADLRRLTDHCSPQAEDLLDVFAPGPLTVILPKSALIPDLVTAGLTTVAVRIPAHPVARRLIELAGVPVAAPSANRSGRPSPTRGWHVIEDLDGSIPFIIDAGDCEYGLESTVVDLTGSIPEILRPGAITADQIRSVAGDVAGIGTGKPLALANPEKPRSPGMKYRHYAPRAELRIIEAADLGERSRCFREQLDARLRPADWRAPTARRCTVPPAIGLYACAQVLASLAGAPGPAGLLVRWQPVRLGLTGLDLHGLQPAGHGLPGGEAVIYAIAYGDTPDAVAAARHLFDALRSFDALDVDLILAEGLPDTAAGVGYMNRLRKAAGGGESVAGMQKGALTL